MRNAVIWGFDRNGAPEAIRQLQESGLLNVRAWFADGQRCPHGTVTFREVFAQKFDTSTTGDVFHDPDWHHCRDAVATHLPRFLDMGSRTRYGRYKTHGDHVHLFHLCVRFFYDFLKRLDADVVFFASFPHFGIEFVLYAVARHLGIPTVLAHQSLVPNRFFSTARMEDLGRSASTRDADDRDAVEEEWQSVPAGFKKTLFYMGKMRRQKSRWLSLSGRLMKHVVRNRHRLSPFEIAKRFEQAGDFQADVRAETHVDIELEREFVYFPLHLQPELSTSALGGVFSDQMRALERLREILPDDWWIYVKENPKQKPQQRGRAFYERLRRLPQVVMVDRTVDTYLLLSHCQFVATITGTAGWEAITGGKCALVFGRAWYRSLPGVFEYHPEFRLEEILDCQFDHTELEQRFNDLMGQAYPGVTDPAYNVIVPDFSEAKNIDRLRHFMETELKRAA